MPFAAPSEVEGLRAEARRSAQHALALNPRSGEAYFALALLVPEGRLAEKEALFRHGLDVDPGNEDIRSYLGDLLAATGRTAEAVAQLQRALALDPLSPSKTAGLAAILASSGRCSEAISTISRASRIWPTYPQIWQGRLHVLADCGREDEARAMLARPDQAGAPIEAEVLTAWRAYVEALKAGTPRTTAVAVQAILAGRRSGQIGRSTSMAMLARLGEVDAAFDLADSSFSAPAAGGPAEPRFDLGVLFRDSARDVRADPRFMPLAARAGLVDYWRATRTWPDFCAQPDRPYDCRAMAPAATR